MRLTVFAIPLFACACALHHTPSPIERAHEEEMGARLPRNLPVRFLPVASSGADSTLANSGTVCPRAMYDPRDSTAVHLERVRLLGSGDYAVPGARYGVRPGELLRLHCANGTAAGFVPR